MERLSSICIQHNANDAKKREKVSIVCQWNWRRKDMDWSLKMSKRGKERRLFSWSKIDRSDSESYYCCLLFPHMANSRCGKETSVDSKHVRWNVRSTLKKKRATDREKERKTDRIFASVSMTMLDRRMWGNGQSNNLIKLFGSIPITIQLALVQS